MLFAIDESMQQFFPLHRNTLLAGVSSGYVDERLTVRHIYHSVFSVDSRRRL